MVKVLIAIQARSTSTRYPGKVFEKTDNKEVLQMVLDAANESCLYINKYTDKNKILASVALLIPYNDPIKAKYEHKNIIIEGSENDVLDRFYQAAIKTEADYIVRITSDCPLLPSYLISKHLNVCTRNKFDYVSNVDPDCRTCPDGHDVEIMSKRALIWAKENAKEAAEKEHVTLILRTTKLPDSFRVAHVIGQIFQPDYKISFDTVDDLEKIKSEYRKVDECLQNAYKKSGKGSVFRV